MTWGGSLNKKGSDHLRKIREADKVIAFLERFKIDLNPEEKEYLSRTIGIITEYITKISEDDE